METKKIYKCLIVDDEPLARQLIQAHLAQFPHFELVNSFASPIEALLFLSSEKIDLIFLDIQMPKLSGIDFLKSLKNPPKVIFTTAYSEFALEGYELNVIDYLLKPITFERFYKAMGKVSEIFALENQITEPSAINPQENAILIKSSHQLIKINLSDILYIEGLHKYVKIITKTKTYTSFIGMSAMENELPLGKFYRCHRSFIVNLAEIQLIDGHQAILAQHQVPISKNNKEELIAKLGKQIS